ncbi:hypothetical protein H312_01536 [Anncaliia algerae PRA339]|uniref:Alanyl-tRNA synthetase class IIc N-terminal domain-containing protein n=1 Tax=Anncaliia algerae PRA339 TaxID=1288291 RepID=A0A059F1N1_9MICR|nr:hypothetical protein H312_01536 [Anncaliia algerae PRA339]
MTELIYFNDQEILQAKAQVKNIIIEKNALITDRTPFYPKGGGQLSDVGIIKNNAFHCQVINVCKENDMIYHIIANSTGEINVNDNVDMIVDSKVRNLHSRLHSAGHIIDIALFSLEFSKNVTVTRACHYPKESSVSYLGKLVYTKEDTLRMIQEKCDELINEDIKIEILHEENNMRYTFIKGYKIACGGTHVKSSKEIGKLILKKIVLKKEEFRISYDVE